MHKDHFNYRGYLGVSSFRLYYRNIGLALRHVLDLDYKYTVIFFDSNEYGACNSYDLFKVLK